MRKFSKSTWGMTILVAVCAAFVFAPAAKAQDVANGSATANVLAALTVTAGTLAFGDVYQGVPKAVAKSTASAGVFTITGAANAGISMYMQLPDYLSIAGDSDRMVISFGATDAALDTTGLSAGDPTAYVSGNGYDDADPHNLPATNMDAGARIDIYLGGSVFPTVDQTAGAYSADIILTVSYDGT